jgi:hypothetical protein
MVMVLAHHIAVDVVLVVVVVLIKRDSFGVAAAKK